MLDLEGPHRRRGNLPPRRARMANPRHAAMDPTPETDIPSKQGAFFHESLLIGNFDIVTILFHVVGFQYWLGVSLFTATRAE